MRKAEKYLRVEGRTRDKGRLPPGLTWPSSPSTVSGSYPPDLGPPQGCLAGTPEPPGCTGGRLPGTPVSRQRCTRSRSGWTYDPDTWWAAVQHRAAEPGRWGLSNRLQTADDSGSSSPICCSGAANISPSTYRGPDKPDCNMTPCVNTSHRLSTTRKAILHFWDNRMTKRPDCWRKRLPTARRCSRWGCWRRLWRPSIWGSCWRCWWRRWDRTRPTWRCWSPGIWCRVSVSCCNATRAKNRTDNNYAASHHDAMCCHSFLEDTTQAKTHIIIFLSPVSLSHTIWRLRFPRHTIN